MIKKIFSKIKFFIKEILIKNALNVFISIGAIVLFYFLKFSFNVYTNFPIEFNNFSTFLLISLSSIVNLFLAYINYLKLLFSSRSFKKTRNVTFLIILILVIGAVINDLVMYLLIDLISLSTTIASLITFVIIFFITKKLKKKIKTNIAYKKRES